MLYGVTTWMAEGKARASDASGTGIRRRGVPHDRAGVLRPDTP
ncbi:hypothetical protein ABZ370_09285 [Streptomyces sp. NPDC005962]